MHCTDLLLRDVDFVTWLEAGFIYLKILTKQKQQLKEKGLGASITFPEIKILKWNRSSI